MTKYRAKPVVIDGIRFASTKEGARYTELKMLQKTKKIYGLILQPKFPITINGKLCFKYAADFEYMEKGKRIIEDVKGVLTPVYRLKKKCVEAAYGVKITEV